jgi:hypothetical protein
MGIWDQIGMLLALESWRSENPMGHAGPTETSLEDNFGQTKLVHIDPLNKHKEAEPSERAQVGNTGRW